MTQHVVAIDQGTTSTRAIVFDARGVAVATAQREHRQIFPRAGWVEHDPEEIWTNTMWAVASAMRTARLSPADVAAIGITNQRETVVVWDRATGRPIHNALVWQDTRTQPALDALPEDARAAIGRITGLPLSAYFSASKIAWLLDAVPGARAAAWRGALLAGTMDSWLIWNLTGGARGGTHLTDATNASRTMLLGLDDLEWSAPLLDLFDIPREILPGIVPSSGRVGEAVEPSAVRGVPISGILGDQQAAAFGQGAFDAGEVKATYGTGNFILVCTGEERIRSTRGLLTTVAYQLAGRPPAYGLEGSIAVTGSLVQWLRDNLGVIGEADDVERLAASVDDNGGAYVVPAFSGLFAPHWDQNARGTIVGLTRYVDRAHLARAVLEATAFQTYDVIEAVEADLGVSLQELRVDGGMTRNGLLMQFQADILDKRLTSGAISEITALGAAHAAGLAEGVWADLDALRALRRPGPSWSPGMDESLRQRRVRLWRKAVRRSLDWIDDDARALMGAGDTRAAAAPALECDLDAETGEELVPAPS